jgi:hypothetical protein
MLFFGSSVPLRHVFRAGGDDLHRKPEPGFYEELHRLEKQTGTDTTSGGLLPPIPAGIVVVVVVGLGVLGVAFLRGRGTEDRPLDVLNAYVQATLSANDDRAAAELTCRAPRLESIRSWQRDLMSRRQRLNRPPAAEPAPRRYEAGRGLNV